MARKPRYEQIADIPIEEIAKLKAKNPDDMKKLAQYINSLRRGFNARVRQIHKAGLYSYAADATAERSKLKNVPASQITKGKDPASARNALLAEFAKYQQFFEDKTSTVSGILEENRKQDERIFGVDDQGNPLGTLTEEQRVDFWSAWSEFQNQNANLVSTREYSARAVQMLREVLYENGFGKKEDLMDTAKQFVLDQMKERMEAYIRYSEEKTMRDAANVYAGNRND